MVHEKDNSVKQVAGVMNSSSNENKVLFDNLFQRWNLDYRHNEYDLRKAIDFLSRIYYRQKFNSEFKMIYYGK